MLFELSQVQNPGRNRKVVSVSFILMTVPLHKFVLVFLEVTAYLV
jgi:hypothetical protein